MIKIDINRADNGYTINVYGYDERSYGSVYGDNMIVIKTLVAPGLSEAKALACDELAGHFDKAMMEYLRDTPVPDEQELKKKKWWWI